MNTRFLVALLLSLCVTSAFAQKSQTIVVQNYYYPKDGLENDVYEWRLRASAVREKLGLPKGRVLKKISGVDGPYVIWECEYPSMEAREKDIAVLEKSDDFKKVEEHMSTLLDKFSRSIWEIAP